MVNKCIECGKIVESSKLYCKICEKAVRERIELRKKQSERIVGADFFERQRMK